MSDNSKICPSCREKNNPAFTACWKCGYSFTTVPCPFCEAKISRTAKKCQFCGEWVNAVSAAADQKTVVRDGPPQRSGPEKETIREIIIENKPGHAGLAKFFGFILAVIIFLGVGWVIFKSVATPEQYSSITATISSTINKIQDDLSR